MKPDDERWSQIQFFTPAEFDCGCGCGLSNPSFPFLKKLDQAREIAGVAFRINSGTRCIRHNADVGGVDSSTHLGEGRESRAADIDARGFRQRWKVRVGCIRAGFNRFGTGDSFLHVDDDPEKDPDVEWVY